MSRQSTCNISKLSSFSPFVFTAIWEKRLDLWIHHFFYGKDVNGIQSHLDILQNASKNVIECELFFFFAYYISQSFTKKIIYKKSKKTKELKIRYRVLPLTIRENLIRELQWKRNEYIASKYFSLQLYQFQ